MSTPNVIGFAEPTRAMNCQQALAFIARTRRQLDRFDDALPHPEGESIDPAEAVAIRQMCDALEADITASMTTP